MDRLRRVATVASIIAIALFGALVAARALALPVPSGIQLLPGERVLRVKLPDARAFSLPPVAGTDNPDWPLVMIDPGHGGFDYGARAPGYDEKDLVLGLALALRDRLVTDGGLRVAMTRADDRFVPLRDRAEAARQLGAAAFVSIHADSAGTDSARVGEVSGASVYVLSDRASSAAARRFAARENAAASINGQALTGQSEAVSAILVDLSQRRTQERSERLAALIEREGRGILTFHPQARRSANLEVLRAPDVPSVLFESGYITNPRDASRIASEAGRAAFARVIARAIRFHFAVESMSGDDQGQPPIASPATAP